MMKLYLKKSPQRSRKLHNVVFLLLLIFASSNLFSQTYPPSCVVTAPHSNAYFQAESDVVIRVYSTDIGKTQNNGTVDLVECFVNDEKIGETTVHNNNTYEFTWRCTQTGEYRITARATNNRGVSFTSAGQFVTVGTQSVTEMGISTNKGKYLANIIPGSAQRDYNKYWNGVTAENSCKWGSVESSRDNMSFGGADVSYNHAKNNNLMFRYHAIAWGNQTPSWLQGLQNDVPSFKAELEEYIQAIAARYKYVDQVDVLNEQIGTHAPNTQWFRNGLGGAGSTGYDWAVYLFERARELLPNTKLIINDYGLVGSSTAINQQLDLMKHLRDRGLVDGFGTQSHDFSVDQQSAAGLQSSLDQMTNGGVPIFVTELDLRGGLDSENNESQQLQSYQTHFPVYWEHPHVAGITLWGYVLGSTWRTGTGILLSNGTERSALRWLREYVTGQTDVGYPFGFIPGSCCETPAPTVSQTMYRYERGASATQLSASGNSLTWYTPDGNQSSTAPTPSTSEVGTFTYSVTQTGACESSRTNITVIVYEPQAAYGGTPHAVPGRIEFEDFDTGGQDSAYYDTGTGNEADGDCRPDEDVDLEVCTDVGGGCNIGWFTTGEWLEYTVNVVNPGTYNLVIRAANSSGTKVLSITSNGTPLTDNVEIGATGGWQEWEDITITDIQLNAGVQVIRITMEGDDYVNLNYMEFSPVNVGNPPVVNITSPANGISTTANSTISITATATSAESTISKVEFFANGTLIGTDESSPYAYSWSGMSEGQYTITATATDADGLTNSDEISITIIAGENAIALNRGWNLIAFTFQTPTDIERALANIAGKVLAVKDMDAFWSASNPDFLNSLLQFEYGKGYAIYVNESCDLIWNVE